MFLDSSIFRKYQRIAARWASFFLIAALGTEMARATWMLLPEPGKVASMARLVEPPGEVVSGEGSIQEIPDILATLRQYNPWENPAKKITPSLPPPKVTEVAVDSRLNLILIGAMILPGNGSWAVLIRKNSKNKQMSLRRGEEVDGALLERIERNAVFFRNDGRLEKIVRETLKMAEPLQANIKAAKPLQANIKAAKPLQGNIKVAGEGKTPLSKHISRRRYEGLLSRGVGMLTDLNVQPFLHNGQAEGYRISFKKDMPDLRFLGLSNGDVITKVNGVSVMDTRAIGGLTTGMRDFNALNFELIRDNRTKKLNVDIGS